MFVVKEPMLATMNFEVGVVKHLLSLTIQQDHKSYINNAARVIIIIVTI